MADISSGEKSLFSPRYLTEMAGFPFFSMTLNGLYETN